MKRCDWGLFELHEGDCLDVMRGLPGNSIDSIVTDPPYGLTAGKKGGTGVASVNLESPYGRARIGTGNGPGGFMGLKWDSDVPPVEVWVECLRVLKPGGYLLCFAGTRTQHRMATRIEDAGFEIRDLLMWVYGSGFPKSLNVSKAIDAAAGAEREVLSVGKPVKRMIPGADQNATGSWVKDNGREFTPSVTAPATESAKQWEGWGTALKPALEPITLARKPLVGTVAANVLLHGTGALNIDASRVGTTDDLNGGAYAEVGGRSESHSLHVGSGMNQSGKTVGTAFVQPEGRWPANLIHDGSDEVLAAFPQAGGALAPVQGTEPGGKTANTFGDFAGRAASDQRDGGGSVARFFYCPKAGRKDRGEDNTHPTVKPTDLMRYLVRLVTPPGGLVLDPFCGSGSTGKAAMLEGFRFFGADLSPDYLTIAERRIVMAGWGPAAFGEAA